jgi:hypothetical protein
MQRWRSWSVCVAEAWPIDVHGPEALPRPLAAPLAERLERGETVRKVLWVPADQGPLSAEARKAGLWTLTRGDQVLAATDRRLVVGTEAAAEPAARWVAIPYADVLAWAVTESLLYGRVDVCGGGSGRLVSASVEFNTVGRGLIEEALRPLQAAALGHDARPMSSRVPEEPDPPGLPMKFVSFLRHELLAGERPVGLVFEQPRVVHFLGLWRRLARPGQLIATTDLRLLVIREEPGVEEAGHGYTAVSLPRRHLADLVVIDTGPRLAVRHGGGVAVLGPPQAMGLG